MRHRLAAFASVVLLAALAGACGGSGSSADAGLSVTLNEWSVADSVADVSSGTVDFAVKNGGSIQHELVILKTDLPPDQLVLDGSKVDESASGQVIGTIGAIPGGGRSSDTVDLPPGNYVLFCNIAGHYQAGMHTSLEVK